MSLFSKNETGKPCQACGHETSSDDKAVKTTSGARVHESHTTDPSSGFYGDRKRLFRR